MLGLDHKLSGLSRYSRLWPQFGIIGWRFAVDIFVISRPNITGSDIFPDVW